MAVDCARFLVDILVSINLALFLSIMVRRLMLIMNDFVKEVDEQMLGIQNKNSSYFVEW